MLKKIITWLYQRTIIKERKSQIKKNLSEREKKTQELYNHFKELSDFVRWLNQKALKNRKQRKSFWRDVSQGNRLVEDVIEKLINQYDPDILPKMIDTDVRIKRLERKIQKLKTLVKTLKEAKKQRENKKNEKK